MENELKVLEEISHPNIVRIYELLEDKDNYYIVSELMKHGELWEFGEQRMNEEEYFTEDQIMVIAKELFLALNFMHQQNLVHRDLKPQNIMISNPQTLELKIIDFGFATYFDRQAKMDVGAGSPVYCAPEIVKS